MKKNKVAVLMSTYNGEKYIDEQINTVLNQNDVDITLFIRDDGSKDEMKEKLKQYEANEKINILYENNLGYAASFWKLLKDVSSDYDYYAFCDQDDIWQEDKMISAIKKIEIYNDIPVLYTSRVISVNNEMRILTDNTFKFVGTLNKYESLQRSVVPGCVFVFNNSAKVLISKYDGYLESHDWATYAIVNAFGKVVYDNNSYIKYRIHENNTIGQKGKLGNLLIKFNRFFKKSKCVRSRFAEDFYNTYVLDITDEKYKSSVQQLAYYKKNLKLKFKLLFNKKFKGIVFKIYVLLNKI